MEAPLCRRRLIGSGFPYDSKHETILDYDSVKVFQLHIAGSAKHYESEVRGLVLLT
jgi:hypothetical protein